MTETRSEIDERLADLEAGPWAGKAKLARKYFAPETDMGAMAESDAVINLDSEVQTRLLPTDLARDEELARILRWHGDDDPIVDGAEMVLRDSYDYALSYLMLLELAVETGYLPLHAVRLPARREILSLLWSPSGREFVQQYEYLPVEYLASRVGIRGLREFIAPETNRESEVHFAMFLAHYADWVSDTALNAWLAFLDDYVQFEGEQELFARLLGWGGPVNTDRERTLLAGLDAFLTSLTDLFSSVSNPEVARFGLFHAYWLGRFFGFRLQKSGFVCESRDWGAVVRGSTALFPQQYDDYHRSAMERNVGVLMMAWDATRVLIGQNGSVIGAPTTEALLELA